MAKKRSGSQTPPGSQYIGNRTFPIVPARTQFTSADTTVCVQEVVDLDLDFETYEVFDIYRWESSLSFILANLITADTYEEPFSVISALLEVPSAVTTPGTAPAPDVVALNLFDAAQYEANKDIVCTHEDSLFSEGVETGPPAESLAVFAIRNHSYKKVDMIQPWTVGGNIAHALQWLNVGEGLVESVVARFTLWGRKRNATKEEFYAINYRRFK